jgi:hypothetical protein
VRLRYYRAGTLRLLGRPAEAEAEAEYQQILDVWLRVLGPDHPDTLSIRRGIAAALADQGRAADAEAEYRQVLDARLRGVMFLTFKDEILGTRTVKLPLPAISPVLTLVVYRPEMTVPADAFPAVPGDPIDSARPQRRHPRARRTGPLVATLAWIALALTFVVACSGTATPPRSAGSAPPRVKHKSVLPHIGGDACSLLSAADLSSLGVTGAGAALTGTPGSLPHSVCNWQIDVFNELVLTYTPNFSAARSYVGYQFVLPRIAVPGVGDYALGQFVPDYAEVDFAKGSALVAIQIFGSSAKGSKAALIAVARKVAGEV